MPLPLPLLLQNGEARKLSDDIYKNSGCFPFLYPRQNIIAFTPTGKENPFYYIVCGLYVLYHDYGRKSLNWFLDNYIEDKLLNSQLKGHITTIEAFRGYIAHGSDHLSGGLANTVELRYLHSILKNNISVANKNISNWGKADYQAVCKQLTIDSNALCKYLQNWVSSNQQSLDGKRSNFLSNVINNIAELPLFNRGTEGALMSAGDYTHTTNQIQSKANDIFSTLGIPSKVRDSIKDEIQNGNYKKSIYGTRDVYDIVVKICKDKLYPSSTQALINKMPKP